VGQLALEASVNLPAVDPSAGPQDLVELAKLVDKDPSRASTPVALPGVGETYHLTKFSNIHLFAARGIEEQLSARFFYVILQEKPDVGQLPAYSFFNDQSDGNDEAHKDDKKKVADTAVKMLRTVPTGAPLQFDINLLSRPAARPSTRCWSPKAAFTASTGSARKKNRSRRTSASRC
jgi:hypothetical protein